MYKKLERKRILHAGAVRRPIAEASFGTVQGGRELRPNNKFSVDGG